VNIGQLTALAEKNKPALIGGGAVVAVGVGLYSRKKKAESVAAGGDPRGSEVKAGTPAGLALPYSVGGQSYPMSGAGGVYDSSASDLFGAVSPQLESLRDQMNAMNDKLNTPVPVPAPVAAPPVAAPPPPPPTPATVPVPAPAPAASGPQWVTVQRGDTLSGIAARYREQWITPASIGRLNGIANLNRIYPGQSFRIY
jgi:LysM repeat protein